MSSRDGRLDGLRLGLGRDRVKHARHQLVGQHADHHHGNGFDDQLEGHRMKISHNTRRRTASAPIHKSGVMWYGSRRLETLGMEFLVNTSPLECTTVVELANNTLFLL